MTTMSYCYTYNLKLREAATANRPVVARLEVRAVIEADDLALDEPVERRWYVSKMLAHPIDAEGAPICDTFEVDADDLLHDLILSALLSDDVGEINARWARHLDNIRRLGEAMLPAPVRADALN